MNKSLRLIYFLVFLAITTAGKSQHCPFDGSYVVVVKLLLPPGVDTPTLWLHEPESLNDSCAYGDKQVSIPLHNYDYWWQRALNDIHGQHYRWLFPRLEGKNDFLSGHVAVFLSMASRYCMVPTRENYTYKPRHFTIRCSFMGHEREWVIGPESVYHLCGVSGPWSRISPFVLDLRG